MNVIFAIASVVLTEMIRRKDFYVLFFLTALITVVMGSVNFFHDANIVRYLKEICLLLIWICSLVVAIGTTARQLPSEKEQRTIFPLLAKPVTRAQLIVGKFLGCWLACGLALVAFYLFFGMVAASKEHTFPVGSYFEAMTLHWAALAVVVALALLGSIVLSAPSANATICFVIVLGILGVGMHLNKVAVKAGGFAGLALAAIYYLIPHLEWAYSVRELVIHNKSMPEVGWWFLAMLYYGAYTAAFLFASWLLFRRRALTT